MTNERLCTLAQRGDTQAQEQLIQNNLGYIRKTANELYISVGLGNSELGIDHDDLIQEGSIGLLRAIFLYDPGKKIKFLTYAGPAIRNAILNATGVAIDDAPMTPHILFKRFSEEGLINDPWRKEN